LYYLSCNCSNSFKDKKTKQNEERLENIKKERNENAKIVGRLLEKLDD